MSSFAILNTAYLGLTAARAGMDVTGQNVANLNTEGYTRQRVQQSAAAPLAEMGLGRVAEGRNGQGVTLDATARLGNVFLEARVRQTASTAGYAEVRAAAFADVEDIHAEPSENGVSAQLQSFWAAWQDMANSPGEDAQAWVVLEKAGALANSISSGRAAVEATWQESRTAAGTLTTEVNTLAGKVAALNSQILKATAQGSSVNELTDRRNQLTEQLARLAGAAAQERPDGTVSVTLGGNLLVDGDRTSAVVLAGATAMDSTATDAVRIEWAHRPGTAVTLGGGELAGHLSALAPEGSGGIFAAAAAGYDKLATELARQVNDLHGEDTARTPGGFPATAFFNLNPDLPPAAGLAVGITDPRQVAAAAPGAGGRDGSVADEIAALGRADGGPDGVWQSFVTRTAVGSNAAAFDSSLATVAASSATNGLLSHSAVSLDEETVNLMQYQHAYQGAARVMTAVDEMLDVLINRTGRVGL